MQSRRRHKSHWRDNVSPTLSSPPHPRDWRDTVSPLGILFVPAPCNVPAPRTPPIPPSHRRDQPLTLLQPHTCVPTWGALLHSFHISTYISTYCAVLARAHASSHIRQTSPTCLVPPPTLGAQTCVFETHKGFTTILPWTYACFKRRATFTRPACCVVEPHNASFHSNIRT